MQTKCGETERHGRGQTADAARRAGHGAAADSSRDTDQPDLRERAGGARGASGRSITQETEILIEQGLLTEKSAGRPAHRRPATAVGELVKFYQDDNARRRCVA